MSKRGSLIAALILLALAATMLHLRLHPPNGDDDHGLPETIAAIFYLTDLLLVSFLFFYRRTTGVACLLNGIIAIYGSVMMFHFGLAHNNLLHMMPDIAIAMADLLVGFSLLRITMNQDQPKRTYK